jgi:hypothetical protein
MLHTLLQTASNPNPVTHLCAVCDGVHDDLAGRILHLQCPPPSHTVILETTTQDRTLPAATFRALVKERFDREQQAGPERKPQNIKHRGIKFKTLPLHSKQYRPQ